MNRESQQISSKEMNQYSDLFRARELFINLFRDKNPLINLGYTEQQINYTLSSLKLIQEEGKVKTDYRKCPYLSFSGEEGSWGLSTEIYHLLDYQGFFLDSERGKKITPDMSQTEKIFAFFAEPSVIIFDDYHPQVANIALFNEESPINNLDYLVSILYRDYTKAPLGLQKERYISKFRRDKFGTVGTYQVSWVDERTKLEFVAKIDTPENPNIPYYVHWRKLAPINDEKGAMIPIGKKAGSSSRKIKAILEEGKEKLVFGNLSWERQNI